ncbi:uncharacterized protein [Rutidosis leptorrhynchoides]|uniref:uncharacterized protein n=1 Tax=Rutidosis leptorrhynchoides TaxID=125765 RepID=UPI003A991FC1
MWLNGCVLKDRFSSLYDTSSLPFATVSQFFHFASYVNVIPLWFIHVVRLLSLVNSIKMSELLAILSTVICDVNCEDQLYWSASAEGLFSVSEAVRLMVLSNTADIPSWPKVIWGNNVPSKVMLSHWLAIHNSIPVNDVLIKRHILPSSQSNLCIWCLEDVETFNHLLVHCKWTAKIWADLFRWWKVYWVVPGSIELFFYDWFYGMGIKASKFWKLIGPATIWAIWLARNDFVFNGKFICRSVLVRNIKLKTFLWAVNLKLCRGFQSYIWMENPSLLCF